MTDMEIPEFVRELAKAAVDAVAENKKHLEGDVWVEGYASDFVVATLTTALPHLLTEVAVHHYDIEKHAASFNEGYDEALRQGVGGQASRNWLTEKVWPLLKDHIEPENSHHVADQIADALLSEADLDPSEVKSMCETATALGLALGRKEAADEIAEALKRCRTRARDEGHRGWPLLTEAAVIAREIGSQPRQPVSNGLTASSRHPGTPEDTKPPQEGTRKKPRCPNCNSDRWVSVSLNGGYTRLAQCVPCGAYHKGVIGPGWRSPRFNDPEAEHPDYRDYGRADPLPEESDQ